MKIRLWVAGVLLFPAAAFADVIPGANVDAFYTVKSDVKKAGADSSGGKGFGVRGRVDVPFVFLQGEYDHDKYDNIGPTPDVKFDLTRLGVGMNIGPTPLYGLAEYLHGKFDAGGTSTTDNGYGAHIGIKGTPTPIVSLYGQLGYVKLGNSSTSLGKGPEYNVGAVFSVMPLLGIFADARREDLKENGVKTTITDYRVGVRVSIP